MMWDDLTILVDPCLTIHDSRNEKPIDMKWHSHQATAKILGGRIKMENFLFKHYAK